MAKRGLYANINAKKKRIKAGSGETMRKVGAKGAPKKGAFKEAAKTAKKMATGGALTTRQTNTLAKHAEHHTKKHMTEMKKLMKSGKTFGASHKITMKKVGV